MKFRSPRAASHYQSTLTDADNKQKVTVRDITDAGARVEIGKTELTIGDPIKLWILEKPHSAQVRWVRNGAIGVRFDQALSPRELAVIRQQSRWAPPNTPQRRQVFGFAEL